MLAMGSVLAEAGVSVELHGYPGAPHASDALAPNAESSRRAIIAACADRSRSESDHCRGALRERSAEFGDRRKPVLAGTGRTAPDQCRSRHEAGLIGHH
jgi:hypothetical protein